MKRNHSLVVSPLSQKIVPTTPTRGSQRYRNYKVIVNADMSLNSIATNESRHNSYSVHADAFNQRRRERTVLNADANKERRLVQYRQRRLHYFRVRMHYRRFGTVVLASSTASLVFTSV